ncbi:uncharacterized protein LOC119276732 isoform X2 [Triticum dicoccoides]|uniref:uncharacterized protein LOC119276732 isoform X2 n=1 Tax=Triticum dicoccoides TaxID=85692 RepID=UPI00188E9E75|nr:uncharacterized protein LOC119276732 isoform X2 [Triticum dicoccoides]
MLICMVAVMTGRRSRLSRSASRSFPVTGSLKLKTGHIVLVMSGWKYCGFMSLEQSDTSKIGVKILGAKGIVVVRSMSPASARHGVHSPKEQGFKAGQQASLDESISLLKQRTSKPNGISLSVLQMAILLHKLSEIGNHHLTFFFLKGIEEGKESIGF